MSHPGPEVTTDNGSVASPSLAQHWDSVFCTHPVTDLSWYQWRPTASLAMLDAAGIALDAAVIDVGGGASTLVDALLERGFRDLTCSTSPVVWWSSAPSRQEARTTAPVCALVHTSRPQTASRSSPGWPHAAQWADTPLRPRLRDSFWDSGAVRGEAG